MEKIASKQKSKTSPVKETFAAGVGASLVTKAPEKLLGYHTVYHGTSNKNAEKIKEHGFDPSHGGTRSAKLRERYVENSKGKMHFTKNRASAAGYAGDIGLHLRAAARKNPEAPDIDSAIAKGYKDYLFRGKGKIVKARIPHKMWQKMDFDFDSYSGAEHLAKDRYSAAAESLKEKASTYNKKIGSQFVAGGKGSKGIGNFLHRNHLRGYYGSASGKKRALVGLAQLTTGTGAIGLAAKHNHDNGGVLS